MKITRINQKHNMKKKRGIIENKVFVLERNIFFSMIIVFSIISLVYASTFIDKLQADFNLGTYNWTFYNSSGFVQLNSSRLNGTYTSQIFGSGGSIQWNNISWTSNAIGELPNNQQVETSFANGNINMTGNVLLMHMNEASGTIVDYSGMGNNGTQLGGVSYSAVGKLNNAVGFDGNNGFINIADSNSINLTGNFTISLWMKTSSSATQDLFRKVHIFNSTNRGGTATSSDNYGANPPADAFDGNLTYYGWGSAGSAFPHWLMYNFSSNNKIVTSYRMIMGDDQVGGWSATYNPKTWIFSGFDSLTGTWTNLGSQDTTINSATWYSFSANNSKSYQAYRINISNCQGGAGCGGYVRVTELELWYPDYGYLGQVDSGKFRYAVLNNNSNSVVGNTTVNDGNWHLVTLSFNGTYVNSYIDGVLDSSSASNGSGSTSGISLTIAGTSFNFSGNIDEFSIWNRSLSTAEIGNLYRRGALRLNLSVQSCNNPSCSGASWTNLGSNLTSPQNLNVANNSYFQYKFDFLTDNVSYTPELYNVSIDYTLLDQTPPVITLNTPANNANTSSTNINFNFTATDETSTTLNCSLYIDNVYRNNNGTTQNGTATILNASGLTEGLHIWTINCSDASFNSNASTRNFYIDISSPTVSNIIYSPNLTDNVDPNVNITINATVTDNWIGISSVILQYYNGTSWNNKTMSKFGSTNVYTTNITTVSSEQNYIFNIWANDSLGNSGNSSVNNFSSAWDCTWSVSPSSLEEVVGFYEDKYIGNITLRNTGDIAYSNNNCSISFTTGYTGFSSTYWGTDSWTTNQRGFQMSNSITVSASSNQTFSINASFPSTTSPFTETPSITITSSINDSITRNKTASVLSTLIIAPPNPLLYQEITTYPTTYVYLTPGNFSLKAYLRNLGYDSNNNLNTTAYNVSFNWTLPSAISSRISEGNQTNFYEVLNTSSRQYNNLTIGLTSSNLASMPKGILNITIYSYGYKNNSGNFSLIDNSGGKLILNQTVAIQFLCYDTIDSICVSSCGIGVDPDCKAAETSLGAGAGGGGGGGGALQAVAVASSAEYQLVRGEQNEVKIIFENKDANESLKDLTFSVSGKIAKYIEIAPKQLSSLGAGEKITLILTITSPTYIELGKQELIVTMKAKKSSSDYTDSKKITLEIHELSMEGANKMLNESKELITQLNEANLSFDSLNLLLNKSGEAIKIFNLEIVRDNYNIIKEQVKWALDSKKIIQELSSLIKSAEEKGIDVSESKRLLELAQLSMDRREFEQAYKRIKDSQLTYALEVKGEFGTVGYYLKTYPKEISLGAFFLVIFSFGTYSLNKLRVIKKRIKELKEEEKILNELIKIVQNDCFKKKIMSMNEYETAMKGYNQKLSKIVEELIELETKRTQMLRFTSKTKRLRMEKEKIIDLIKELQDDYMKKKKLETRTFEMKMESFNRRISEIEEKLATLEARKAVKGFGMSFKIPEGE